MLAMSAQSPLNQLAMPGLSSFSAQEVQALQQSFQQQTMQQLALLQQGAAASQFSPQAQFYLQSHVNSKSCFFFFYIYAARWHRAPALPSALNWFNNYYLFIILLWHLNVQ